MTGRFLIPLALVAVENHVDEFSRKCCVEMGAFAFAFVPSEVVTAQHETLAVLVKCLDDARA